VVRNNPQSYPHERRMVGARSTGKNRDMVPKLKARLNPSTCYILEVEYLIALILDISIGKLQRSAVFHDSSLNVVLDSVVSVALISTE